MRIVMAGLVLVLASVVLPAGAQSDTEVETPAVLDARFPETRMTLPLSALAQQVALEEGVEGRVVELGRDTHTSHHIVGLRGAEPFHQHERHDLLVVLVRGHGQMRIGDERRAVGPGSILYVPRGTDHSFENLAPEPAVAYVVYTPAFDGKDRAPAGD